MSATFRTLIDLCLLRRGPQDLPYDAGLTRNLVLLSVATEALYAQLLESSDALPRLALSLALLLGLPWLLLQWRGLAARYVQTLAAFAGSGALFTAAFIPVALWLQSLPVVERPEQMTGEHSIAVLLGYALLGCKLLINAHILRHALSWPLSAGVLLAFGLLLIELGLDRLLFGVPPA